MTVMVSMIIFWRGLIWSYHHGDAEGHERIAFQRLLEATQLYMSNREDENSAILYLDAAMRFMERFPERSLQAVEASTFEMALGQHREAFEAMFESTVVYEVTPSGFFMRDDKGPQATVRVVLMASDDLDLHVEAGQSGRKAMADLSRAMLRYLKKASHPQEPIMR